MLPALMAARPLIKYGILIGVPLAILLASHTYIFFKGDARGEKRILTQWDAANAKAAKESNRQILAVQALEVKLAEEQARNERVLAEQSATIKRKVMEYAKSKPSVPLSPGLVSVYDDLRRVSNQAGDRLPAADPSSASPEVPSGEVRSPPAGVVPPADETDPVTTDALYQAVVHTHEILRECKTDYQRFDQWNEGREQIELDRLRRQMDEVARETRPND